jgi:hypothetical protein
MTVQLFCGTATSEVAMGDRQRPAVTELGRYLNMSEVEWAVHDMEQAVEHMIHPRSQPGAFSRVCKLIIDAMRGKQPPREIPL